MLADLDEIISLLKSENDSLVSIKTRTKHILSKFKKYIANKYPAILNSSEEIETISSNISEVLTNYLKGDIIKSITLTENIFYDNFVVKISKNTVLFRGRSSETNFLYSKDKMFHIPFDKRYLVGNQRFSVSGLPCLYLGSSVYICWEELDRADYQKCNFSALCNLKEYSVLDLSLPEKIETLSDVRKIAIIIACSLKCDKTHFFRQEYILPQNLLQVLINKRNTGHKYTSLLGIRFTSSCLLNGTADIYDYNVACNVLSDRYVCYVLPICKCKGKNFCPTLNQLFNRSDSVSSQKYELTKKALLIPNQKVVDMYGSTTFAKIEDILRSQLVKPFVQSGTEFYVGDGGFDSHSGGNGCLECVNYKQKTKLQ